jgi:PAS domain S-box-containing protein
LRGQHFEVAIVDLVMPGMDGIKTIAALKEVDPDIEVMILTGHVTVNSAIAALRQGACDFLEKPIGMTQLRPALRQALERRRDKLARGEARSRAVIETAQEAIVLFDRQGVVRDFNPVAEKILGRTREQVEGRNLADFAIPPQLAEVFKRHLETAYRVGKDPLHGCVEVSALRANGEEFPFEISTAVVDTPQGKLLSTFGRDVTERKRMVEALWASEEQFRHLAENIDAVLFVGAPDPPRLTYISPAYEKNLGTPLPGTLRTGRRLDRLHPPRRPGSSHQPFHRGVSGQAVLCGIPGDPAGRDGAGYGRPRLPIV